jgi:hypothetical protein
MEHEDPPRLDLLAYDEKSETWYVQTCSSQRLMLTRKSLARLVQMYNSIHKGNPLVLLDQREVRRFEEVRRRHSEALRDLSLLLERRRQQAGWGRLRQMLTPGFLRRGLRRDG